MCVLLSVGVLLALPCRRRRRLQLSVIALPRASAPAPLRHAAQFPSAASERQGHGAHELPTLHDALAAVELEQRIDRALEELRRKKESAGK